MLDDRRGLNQHFQLYSKQVRQECTFTSASGVFEKPLWVPTGSSMVINACSSSDGGGSFLDNSGINQIRVMEEQWWLDVVTAGSMVVPSSLSQQENSVLSAIVEVGVPRQHVEDLESMLLTQPADPTITKWLTGDGQTYGQGAILSVQGSAAMDTSMFGQDSWSSNQHHSDYPLGDNSLNGQILHDHIAGNTFSSPLNSCISLSPSSPPSSELNFLHTYTSLPRPLSLPSHLRSISFNPPKRTEVFVPSTIATPIASMDETRGHSFSAPSFVVGTMSLSPNASATEEYYGQCLLVGNSLPEGQLSLENTYTVHQSSSVMKEGPVAMEGSLSSSPSSVPASHVNLPFLTPTYYRHETDKEFGQSSIFQQSFSSVVPCDSVHQQMTIPAVMSRDCQLHRQRPWNTEKTYSQRRQFGPEIRSLNATGEWKPETSKSRTSGALSPLSSEPGFNTRSSMQAGSSFLQARSQEEEDVNLDTGQMDGGVISEGGLAIVNLLLRAAEAVDVGNAEMAKAILARLNQHISPTREKSIHRVAHYFRQALVTRLMGVENFAVHFSQIRALSPIEEFLKINAYVRFCEVSPYPKFAHFTANQAILEALEGEEALHVIDFQMGAGAQWASFLQDIASLRAAGKLVPTVRLTAVGTRVDEIRATGANLGHFARMMNIALEFQAVVTRPECLDVCMLGLRDHEAVAGNFIFSLHELLDGETSSGLSTVLKSVFNARPKVVTVVEQEANHSGPFFQQRFSEALQYYMFLFDSLTSSLDAGADSSVNSSIESHLLAPEIMNIVAFDGVARVERHERLEQWRKRMLAAGFSPRPLSDASQFQAEKLVTQISARRGFLVTRDQGSLLLGWQGRPLLAASSWIC